MSKFRIDVKVSTVATNQFNQDSDISITFYEEVKAVTKEEAILKTKEKFKEDNIIGFLVY